MSITKKEKTRVVVIPIPISWHKQIVEVALKNNRTKTEVVREYMRPSFERVDEAEK